MHANNAMIEKLPFVLGRRFLCACIVGVGILFEKCQRLMFYREIYIKMI
jgi:hypothetical protein